MKVRPIGLRGYRREIRKDEGWDYRINRVLERNKER
jgi:hypothetical protein